MSTLSAVGTNICISPGGGGSNFPSTLTDGTTSMRWVERDGYMHIDKTLTPTGFTGIEGTDWESERSFRLYGIPLTGIGTIADYFLPSEDELLAMYNELKVYSLGNFTNASYWASTEKLYAGSYFGRRVEFYNGGALGLTGKGATLKVRACRSFTSISPTYNLRDIGPAGGLIFYKNGNDYMESAPLDQDDSIWTNVDDFINPVPATDIVIGTGQTNTIAIIGQVGHTDSAAKLCNDYIL